MHALTFGGKEIIHYSTVNDPVLLQPTDVIVKITKAGLCGSDLHVYHGRETGLDNGTVMVHEFTGVVEEAGKDAGKQRHDKNTIQGELRRSPVGTEVSHEEEFDLC